MWRTKVTVRLGESGPGPETDLTEDRGETDQTRGTGRGAGTGNATEIENATGITRKVTERGRENVTGREVEETEIGRGNIVRETPRKGKLNLSLFQGERCVDFD